MPGRKAPVSLLVLALVLAVPAFAQMGQGGQMGKMGPGMHHYDKSTETTLTGEVTEVLDQEHGAGMGLHLTVEANSQLYDIALGPASWVEQQGFEFQKGDKVEITGSDVQLKEQHLLLAREITKDGKVLKLRDEDGLPLWSGRKMGKMDR